MPEVCTVYRDSSEEGVVVQFLRRVTFELAVKRSIKQQFSKYDLGVHGGPQDVFQQVWEIKTFT